MTVSNLCDCSFTKIYNAVVQCRSCGGDCSGNCPKNSFNAESVSRQIQNQAGVSQSQMIGVKDAFYIGGDKIQSIKKNPALKPYNNLSDRSTAHIVKLSSVIPTRGDSVSRSVTSNKPGSMGPGGTGVDVKHGSYARYLGKLKASNIGPDGKSVSQSQTIPGARNRPAVNNKQYRFSIISNKCCS